MNTAYYTERPIFRDNCWKFINCLHYSRCLDCLHYLHCFHSAHCLHCLKYQNRFGAKWLLCLYIIRQYCFAGFWAIDGSGWWSGLIYISIAVYTYISQLWGDTLREFNPRKSGNVDYVRSSNIDSSKMLQMQKFSDKKRKISLPIHLFSKPTVGEVRRCHSY